MEKLLTELKEIRTLTQDKLSVVEKRLEDIDNKYEKLKIDIAREKPKTSLPDDNAKSFSLQKAICAISTGRWENAKVEKEVFEKQLATSPGGAGGFIVPPQYIPDLIEAIHAQTVTRELGASVLTGLVGSPVEIPRVAGGATGYWIAENAPITPSQPTFGQLRLTPRQAASLTRFSNRLLMLSNPSVEGIVRGDIAKAIAKLIDIAALIGTGRDEQPRGILNTEGVNILDALNAPLHIDMLYMLEYAIENADIKGDKLGFAFHPRVKHILRTLKDEVGRHYIQPDPTKPEAGTLLGYPYRITTQIPIVENRTTLFFGNWSDLVIGEWTGMTVLASQEAADAFERNQTWVRIVQEIDIGIRHPQAFAVYRNVNVAL